MALAFIGSHRDVTWRAVVEGKRVTIARGGSGDKTYKLDHEASEQEVRSLAQSFINDTIDGPMRAN